MKKRKKLNVNESKILRANHIIAKRNKFGTYGKKGRIKEKVCICVASQPRVLQ